jgi:hypothetical protein
MEKAVDLVLEALKKNPPSAPKKPAYPNYHKKEKETGVSFGAMPRAGEASGR